MEPDDALVGPDWFVALGRDWFRALVRKRRAASTVRTYETSLRDLGRALEAEGIDDANLLNRQLLERWQDGLVGRVAEKTQAIYVTGVRGLLRWGGREGRVPPGLADWLETPHVPEHEPLVLEPDQLQAALGHFQRGRGDLRYYRDRALFWFLVTSSARISEVLGLDLVDIDRTRWVVRQKGGSQKALVISTVARAWLAQYMQVRGKDAEPALWIYVGPIAGRRRLTRGDANRIWRRLCAELGIPRFTSRWLRGTSATELNELGNTAQDAAQHLGHSNLASIMRYTKVRTKRRQAMVDGLDELVPPAPAPAPVRRGRPRGKGSRQAPDSS